MGWSTGLLEEELPFRGNRGLALYSYARIHLLQSFVDCLDGGFHLANLSLSTGALSTVIFSFSVMTKIIGSALST